MAPAVEDLEAWSCDSNEALNVRLKHRDPAKDVDFNPQFTYPIFGDEQTVFGYKDLSINLTFTSDTLQPELDITWSEKITTVGNTEADEPEAELRKFLPTLDQEIDQDESGQPFEPPGQLLRTYDVTGRTFGIWVASLVDPAAKKILERMQIFVPLLIDGGTAIQLSDPDWSLARWKIFFVYAMDKPLKPTAPTSYSLAGYATAYRLFFLDLEDGHRPTLGQEAPVSDDWEIPAELPKTSCRERISQFLVLPPYQGSGHGSYLYNTMLSQFLADSSVKEITVEDPNEDFDRMRDQNDLQRLRLHAEFSAVAIDTNVSITSHQNPLPLSKLLPNDELAKIRTVTKTMPRQFSNVLEMQLLGNIPPHHRSMSRITRRDKSKDPFDRAYYFWRLIVKHRLTLHNLDVLAQLDLEERIEKLDDALARVERTYKTYLDKAGDRPANGIDFIELDADKPKSDVNGSHIKKGKRRRIVDEDDSSEGADSAVTTASLSKKRKA